MGNIVETNQNLIDGVVMQPLKTITDERGFVKHMLRSDSPLYETFGEIYFSYTNYQYIKAWKVHKKITQMIAVVQGNLKLVLFDPRKNTSSLGRIMTLNIGEDNYCLVKIPPAVIYGFQSISKPGTLIASFINAPYDMDEVQAFSLHDEQIPYTWS